MLWCIGRNNIGWNIKTTSLVSVTAVMSRNLLDSWVESKVVTGQLIDCSLWGTHEIQYKSPLQTGGSKTLGLGISKRRLMFLFLSTYKSIHDSAHDFIRNSLYSSYPTATKKSGPALHNWVMLKIMFRAPLLTIVVEMHFSLLGQRWWNTSPESSVRLGSACF